MKICARSIFILLHNSSLKKVLKFHVLSQNFKYKLFRPAFVFQYQDTTVRKTSGGKVDGKHKLQSYVQELDGLSELLLTETLI